MRAAPLATHQHPFSLNTGDKLEGGGLFLYYVLCKCTQISKFRNANGQKPVGASLYSMLFGKDNQET